VVQANHQQFADAATLYESGLRKNPWHRDALFNAANVFLALHQPDKMADVVERLRAADPMNPDVLRLAGAVWQERGRLTTDARARTMCQDSVMAYLDRASTLPAQVTVTRFTPHADNKVTLAGVVQNMGAATASFAVQFYLLDSSGATVGSVLVNADQLASKGFHEFSDQITAIGAVAWRYSMK
ncbi:MAG TPA: tetratricopeptide repeat protein, partial [Gemmatimonadaceae bacterium]